MVNKSLRVALFGVFGSGNLGNEGSLDTMLLYLRRKWPQADVDCICLAPEKIESRHGIRSLALSWSGFSNPLLRALNNALLKMPSRLINILRAILYISCYDVMIVPGTGILDDYGEGPWAMPFGIFRWCLAARLCGVKIGFVSIGAGPIYHPVSRWLMKTALSMSHYRSYRDQYSKDYMASIGFDSRLDPVFPDIAFSLPKAQAVLRSAPEKVPLTIGVGVMRYYGWRNDSEAGREIFESYLRKMSEFTLWLMRRGHSVRLLIGEDSDWEAVEEVSRLVQAAEPRLAAEQLFARPIASLPDLMDEMAATDMIVATRFHNVVCALNMGLPTISIGYARKNDVLLADMGLPNASQSVEELDLGVLQAQFEAMLPMREEYHKAICARVADYKEQLQAQEKLIEAKLLSTAQPSNVEALSVRS